MKTDDLIKALRHCARDGDGGCEGCPLDYVHLYDAGCIREMAAAAADEIEKLTDRCARYAEEIVVLQEKEKWISTTERLPEVWRNDETSELVNYMIYSPDFGIDIGSYHVKAKKWLCIGLPVRVTHWMPLPEQPEGEQ